MARSVASRYENALLYGPGMAVGRYPEISYNTLPQAVRLPTVTPLPLPNGGVAAAPTYSSVAPVGVGTMGGGGNALLAAGAGGIGATLAPVAVKAVGKALPFMMENGSISGMDIPGSPGLAPGDTVPAVDVSANYGGGLEQAFGSAASYVPATLEMAGGYSAPAVDVLANYGGGLEQAFGSAAMQSAEGGVAAAPVSGALGGLGDLIGGGLMNAGASFLGGMAGKYLGEAAFGEGDPEDRPATQASGTAAGAAFGSMFGPIGTAVGALIGAFAGTAFGGQPDYPYAWSGFTVDPSSQSLVSTGADALNHATPGYAARLGGGVQDYITNRAAAEGLSLNPAMANQGFHVGFYGKDHDLFYDAFGGGTDAMAGSDTHQWTGRDANALMDHAYGDLVSRGYFTQAPTVGWGQVNDFISQAAAANPITYGYSGEVGGESRTGGYAPGEIYWGMPISTTPQAAYGSEAWFSSPAVYSSAGGNDPGAGG